jgi:lipopolysaccharide transport protein LptA
MTANDNSKIVTFSGRVVARQDDMIISCAVMKVHYQPRQGSPTAASSGVENTPGLSPGVTPSGTANVATGGDVLAPDPDVPEVPDTAATLETQTNQISKSPAFSGGQEIEKVECEGDVKIQQGDRLAVGQKATYLARSTPRRLILTGDARVWQGRNAVTGHEVTYFLDENRSQVESQNNSRVRAFYEKPVPKKPTK